MGIERAGAQVMIDTEALRTAERAVTLVQSHIDECRESKRQIINEIKESRSDSNAGRKSLHERIDRIYYMALVAGGTVILTLLGLSGALAKYVIDAQNQARTERHHALD